MKRRKGGVSRFEKERDSAMKYIHVRERGKKQERQRERDEEMEGVAKPRTGRRERKRNTTRRGHRLSGGKAKPTNPRQFEAGGTPAFLVYAFLGLAPSHEKRNQV